MKLGLLVLFLFLSSVVNEYLNFRIFIVKDRYLKEFQTSWIGNRKKLSFSLPQKFFFTSSTLAAVLELKVAIAHQHIAVYGLQTFTWGVKAPIGQSTLIHLLW